MNNNYTDGSIRQRLLDAGLCELLEHGPADFSLRRVAIAANVSCAAPYRHFKDKDELVRAVIAGIREDWILLAKEIGRVHPAGSSAHVTELLVAGARFWIAGSNFAPFLAAGELAEFDTPIISAIEEFASARSEERNSAEITTTLLSLMYGAVTLVTSGRIDGSTAVESIRKGAAVVLEV